MSTSQPPNSSQIADSLFTSRNVGNRAPGTNLSAMHPVAVTEIANYFGISRQLANRWAQRDDFPAPVAHLSVGRVWELEDVIAWARTWEPAARRLPREP